jgi:hypothetical protein
MLPRDKLSGFALTSNINPMVNILPAIPRMRSLAICRREIGFFYSFNVELTGAARLYRAASSDQRERG